MQDPLDDDRDQHNPVEMDGETWDRVYAWIDDFDDFLDHDHSMDN